MAYRLLKAAKRGLRKAAERTIQRAVRTGMRKQPIGAISFQYALFEGKPVEWKQVDPLRQKFGFAELFLFHGVAMRTGNNAVVVSGPRGVGKTTLLRRLSKQGKAIPIEDGMVIVGKRGNSFFVVETGTYPWRRLRSTIGKIVGGVFGMRKGLFLKQNAKAGAFKRGLALSFAEAAVAETLAAASTRNRRERVFSPSAIPLERIVFLPHQHDWHPPIKIVGHSLHNISGEAMALELRGTRLETVSPFAKKEELAKKLEKAIFGS